ncbi:MAG TPA: LicD family protein [Burkholderiaceae bacterium]|nr:LicD family protein [Burkholderiaceae bacterium]
MHINLSDPAAVLQAANPILTQPHAVAIFARALALLPASDSHDAALQRIQLEMCHGLALFTTHQIDESLGVLRGALYRAATQPMPVPAPRQPVFVNTEVGLALLRQTLVGLAQHGLTAVATGGVLLGLVREGRLLPNDKDLDVVLPMDQLNAAIPIMPTMGWKPA